MCTVTIIPKGTNDFVLTSNRDEAPNRTSLSPDFYFEEDVKLLYPKDNMSGGTWIGVSEKNRLVCVLNGAFVCHERQSSYRLSRGIVAKDFLISDAIESTIENYSLENIEPFTMVIADWNNLLRFFELVWDGEQKHFKELPLEPKIWSSSTLYSEAMRHERLQWFQYFKSDYKLNAESLLLFHKTAGAGNEDYGVVMNRGFVKTTSITQVDKTVDILKMHYENIQNKMVTETIFIFGTL
ncbi:NRDE family protein [Confluentibacter sediminis]|uniref:NRDE family protein n=1 Tax=Confluentibacter sediminis TaxID=2219045 RepID=UPI000DAF187B|nr:NRDE family protein [Confluentibacter sediminis]